MCLEQKLRKQHNMRLKQYTRKTDKILKLREREAQMEVLLRRQEREFEKSLLLEKRIFEDN